MRKFNEYGKNNLFDGEVFMDISNFLSDVVHGCITDWDGYGRYVYVDKKCNLYVDDSCIDFDELAEYDFKHEWYKEVKEFKKSKNTEKYHLLGVFWFNK